MMTLVLLVVIAAIDVRINALSRRQVHHTHTTDQAVLLFGDALQKGLQGRQFLRPRRPAATQHIAILLLREVSPAFLDSNRDRAGFTLHFDPLLAARVHIKELRL